MKGMVDGWRDHTDDDDDNDEVERVESGVVG
jgi:hypothetical protein